MSPYAVIQVLSRDWENPLLSWHQTSTHFPLSSVSNIWTLTSTISHCETREEISYLFTITVAKVGHTSVTGISNEICNSNEDWSQTVNTLEPCLASSPSSWPDGQEYMYPCMHIALRSCPVQVHFLVCSWAPSSCSHWCHLHEEWYHVHSYPLILEVSGSNLGTRPWANNISTSQSTSMHEYAQWVHVFFTLLYNPINAHF